MRCPVCDNELRVYRTWHVSDRHTRHYRRCVQCGTRFRSDEHLDTEPISGRRSSVETLLAQRGVSPAKCKSLLGSYPKEVIRVYCVHLPDLKRSYEERTGRKVMSEPGFLVWMIESNYPVPVSPNGGGEKTTPADFLSPPPTEANDMLWSQVKDHLRRQTSAATYESVLQGLQLVKIDGDVWSMETDKLSKEWIEHRLTNIIKRAIEGIVGKEVELIFISNEKEQVL